MRYTAAAAATVGVGGVGDVVGRSRITAQTSVQVATDGGGGAVTRTRGKTREFRILHDLCRER